MCAEFDDSICGYFEFPDNLAGEHILIYVNELKITFGELIQNLHLCIFKIVYVSIP
jgi:hypothetical protein